MENKYSLSELNNYNKTYNNMIKFLKKTIPENQYVDLMEKFEERAFEDDDRGFGLNSLLKINGFVTMASSIATIMGVKGVIGVSLLSFPSTIVYYLWSKRVRQLSKENKEEYIQFLKVLSENIHNFKYPFGIEKDEDLDMFKKYMCQLKGVDGNEIVDFFKRLEVSKEENYL